MCIRVRAENVCQTINNWEMYPWNTDVVPLEYNVIKGHNSSNLNPNH